MRVPILLVLPSVEPLRESALALRQQRPPAIPLASAEVPRSVEPDPTFAAVPIGTGRTEDADMAMMEPDVSEAFVVRGFVDVETVEQIPDRVDGRPIFADPRRSDGSAY